MRLVGRDRVQDRRHGDCLAPQAFFTCDPSRIHHDTIGIGHDLVELRRDHQQRQPVGAEFADETDDFRMGADIDTARGFRRGSGSLAPWRAIAPAALSAGCPPERSSIRRSGSAGLMSSIAMKRCASRSCSRLPIRRHRPRRGLQCEHDVLAHGQACDDAVRSCAPRGRSRSHGGSRRAASAAGAGGRRG